VCVFVVGVLCGWCACTFCMYVLCVSGVCLRCVAGAGVV